MRMNLQCAIIGVLQRGRLSYEARAARGNRCRGGTVAVGACRDILAGHCSLVCSTLLLLAVLEQAVPGRLSARRPKPTYQHSIATGAGGKIRVQKAGLRAK